MYKVIRIDANGLFVEDVLLEEGQDVPVDCIVIDVPEGLYLPKWDGTSWIEGKAQSEIDALKNVIVVPSDEDRISALESALMMLI